MLALIGAGGGVRRVESACYSDHMTHGRHKIMCVIGAENTRKDSGERGFDLYCAVSGRVTQEAGFSNFQNFTSERESCSNSGHLRILLMHLADKMPITWNKQ